jgi:dihydroorotase
LALLKKRADRQKDSRDQNLLVKDANIWTGNGFDKGSILIEAGRIKRIARVVEDRSVERVDASGLYAIPGLVDVHVHLRDMRLEYKEDFSTGTAAAAAGGFTTVLDMPNTVPPTDSPGRLNQKKRTAARKVHVNVGFHAAAVSDARTLGGLVDEGAFSIKLYMPKPIAPIDVASDAELLSMMNNARHAGITVTIHAEQVDQDAHTKKPESFRKLAESRSSLMETRAVDRIIRLQRMTGCRVHLCHLTLPSSLAKVAEASQKITSEVTPHHLLLTNKLLSKVGWRAWMVPPLRSEATRRQLLSAMLSGSCDVVASDHAPHTIREKQRPPENSPPGIPGLETTMPLMLTLVNKGILKISRIVKVLAENPAQIFGLKSKGKLRSGYDGDITLVDMKKRDRINSEKFFSKAKYSPFDGFRTKGSVASTIVRGRVVYENGELVGKAGYGSVLRSDFRS